MSFFLFSAVSVLPFVPSYFVFISVIFYCFYFFPEFCQSHFTGEFWKLITFLPFAHILSYRTSVVVLPQLSILLLLLWFVYHLHDITYTITIIVLIPAIHNDNDNKTVLLFLMEWVGFPKPGHCWKILSKEEPRQPRTLCPLLRGDRLCCDMAQPVVPVPPATCLLLWANWRPQRAYLTSCAHPVPVNMGQGFHSSGRVLTLMPCHSGGPFWNLSLWTLLSPLLHLLFTCPRWFSVQSQPIQGSLRALWNLGYIHLQFCANYGLCTL